MSGTSILQCQWTYLTVALCCFSLVFIILLVPQDVSAQPFQCGTVGHDLQSSQTKLTDFGFYLNTQNPAPCSGNVTTWEYCYYQPDASLRMSLNVDAAFQVPFGIYRLNGSKISDIFLISISNSNIGTGPFTCQTFNMSSVTTIQKDDIIGACIHDAVTGNSNAARAEAHLNLAGDNADGYSVHTADTSNRRCDKGIYNNKVVTVPASVSESVLTNRNSTILHLFAHIETTTGTEPPTTSTAAETTASTRVATQTTDDSITTTSESVFTTDTVTGTVITTVIESTTIETTTTTETTASTRVTTKTTNIEPNTDDSITTTSESVFRTDTVTDSVSDSEPSSAVTISAAPTRTAPADDDMNIDTVGTLEPATIIYSNGSEVPSDSVAAIVSGTVAGGLILVIAVIILCLLIAVTVFLSKRMKQSTLNLQTAATIEHLELEQNEAYVLTNKATTIPTVDNEAYGKRTNPIPTKQNVAYTSATNPDILAQSGVYDYIDVHAVRS